MHSIFEMKFNPSSLNSQYAKSMCGPLKFLFSNYNFKFLRRLPFYRMNEGMRMKYFKLDFIGKKTFNGLNSWFSIFCRHCPGALWRSGRPLHIKNLKQQSLTLPPPPPPMADPSPLIASMFINFMSSVKGLGALSCH